MGRPHTRATLQEKGYHFELGLIRAGQMAKRPPSLKMPTFTLQRSSGMPLHRQVYLAVRELVLTGRLREGERLPSSRALAKTLGISRNTVINACARLAEKNLTVSTVGSGTHVAITLPHLSITSRSRPCRQSREAFSRPSGSSKAYRSIRIQQREKP